MSHNVIFSFIILLNLFLSVAQASTTANTSKIKIEIYEKAKFLFSDLEKNGLKEKQSVVNRIDPTSKTKHNYTGYFLSDFINFIKKQYDLKKIDHIETIAKDGYKVIINKENLKIKGAFIAVHISDVNKKGLYNHSLKTYFKWQPSYILFNQSDKKTSVTSPYQVTKIIIHENKIKTSLLDKVHSSKRSGAKVFIRSCSKCHAYKGFGGKKAPKINIVIKRWKRKNDNELKSFLKNPQLTIKRKIQMSPYSGSDKDLDYLVEFLRSIK